MKQLRVIIAGGGTGGHIFPAVAIGHALKRVEPNVELLFVGANGKMEMEKIPLEGFKIIGLDIAGFNRNNLLKNILLPFKLLKSAWAARGIIKNFRPDVVIGVGGYASFPILNAAQQMGIETLIQEQNSYAGKSNKYLGRKAKAICVAYENMEQFFPKDKIKVTGNPVRKLIVQSVCSREEGLSFFGLDKSKTTILVVGGSLGAKSINEAVAEFCGKIIGENRQIIWQTGKPFFEQARHIADAFSDEVKVLDFIKDMDKAYAAADIVISRAGALAIAELCIVAKPVIFVPYPYAAEDHQTSNAMALVNKNAAWMVKDENVGDQLFDVLLTLLANKQMQGEMRIQLEKLAIKNADEQIVHYIIDLVNKKTR
jgi:UDP-N-acetylglucosamine--N-acetylmuramyl-(pentapeptide) pyrophosphoryl-undecaprenol N-acetylglucosamine transferase